jgi:hypothetical protein
MARGGHGLPEVLARPAMPLLCPEGRIPVKRPEGLFRSGPHTGIFFVVIGPLHNLPNYSNSIFVILKFPKTPNGQPCFDRPSSKARVGFVNEKQSKVVVF